jgi:hypothetical protein
MPNITITVSDDVYRIARIWAAQNDTTVTALVRTVLQTLAPSPELMLQTPELEEVEACIRAMRSM